MQSAKQLRFKISQLRQDKVIYATESIAVFIFSLLLATFLPNLLMQYVFTDPNLTQLPTVVEYSPVAAFVIGMGYFFYAMYGNMKRLGQIKKLEKELDAVVAQGQEGCCGNCDHDHDDASSESLGLLAEKMKSAKTKRSSKR